MIRLKTITLFSSFLNNPKYNSTQGIDIDIKKEMRDNFKYRIDLFCPLYFFINPLDKV